MDEGQMQSKKKRRRSSNRSTEVAQSSSPHQGSSPGHEHEEEEHEVEASTSRIIKYRESQGSSSRKKWKEVEVLKSNAAALLANVKGESSDLLKGERRMVLRSSLKKDQSQRDSVQNINPFENDLIVDHLMGFMSPPEVAKSRLVSKLWNRNAIPHLRRRHVVHIYNDSFPALCEDMERATELPYTRYHFDDFYLFDHNLWINFFRNFGHQLKTLLLSDTFSPSTLEDETELESKEKLRIVLLTADNLVSLTCNEIKHGVFERQFLLTPDELATHRLPWVQYFAADVGGYFYSREFWEGLVQILPGVKMLETGDWMDISEDVWTPFQKLSLEGLTVTKLSQTNLSGFKEFLDTQSQTLKQLKMTQNCHTKLGRLNLPVMSKLTKFEFKGCPHKSNVDFLFNVIYPYQVPNLKTIRICLDCAEVGLANKCFPSVEELIIDETEFNAGHAMTLANLGFTFPKLKKLISKYTFLKYDAIGAIFSNFHNLEELELRIFESHVDREINSVLHGYPEDQEGLGQSSSSFEELVKSPPPQNSLPEMKKLKKLVLHFNTEGADFDFLIDRTGVELGFLKLRPLIQLSLCGSFSISEELVNILAEYHSEVIITLGEDTIPRFYGIASRAVKSDSVEEKEA